VKYKLALILLIAAATVLQTAPAVAQGPIPLDISGVSAASFTTTSAVISWTTNSNAASQVFYDTTSHPAAPEYAYSTAENSTLITLHRVALTLLTPGKVYYYRVRSAVDSRSTVSDEFTFTTLAGTSGGVTPPPNLTSLPPEEAAAVIEKMSPDAAASVLEGANTATVTAILIKTSTARTADILEKMTPEKSTSVMEGINTDKLTGIVQDMSEGLLLERLPGLSPEKLYSISPQALFTALPNVPCEQLVAETPPESPTVAATPVTLYTGPDNARYLTVRTLAREWVVIATAPPLGTVLIRTKNAAENVQTLVGVLTSRPSEITVPLPSNALVSTYFQITVENTTTENIELGYINFRVDRPWQESYQINKWGIFLSRYDSAVRGWVQLPTRKVKEDAGYIYYSAVTSHFSTFAITGYQIVTAPKIRMSNLSVLPAAPKPGDSVTISTDLTNLSNVEITYPATLWINTRIEGGQDVSLKAGETKKVSFTVSRNIDGNYIVRFERLSGQFTIGQAAATQSPAPFPSSSPSRTPVTPMPSVSPSPSPSETPMPVGAGQSSDARWPVIIGIIAGFVALLSGGWMLMTMRSSRRRIRPAAGMTGDPSSLDVGGGVAEEDKAEEAATAEAKADVEELIAKIAREEEEKAGEEVGERREEEKARLDTLKAKKGEGAKAESEALTKAQWEALMARLIRDAELARQEVERVKEENARLEAEKTKNAGETAGKTPPVLEDSVKLAEAAAKGKQRRNVLRIKEELEAGAKTRREAEAIAREREHHRTKIQRKARKGPNLYDRMRAVLNTEITFKMQKLEKVPERGPEEPDDSVMLVLINAKTAEDITRFQRRLERIEGVRITMTGGSMVEGILFGITLTMPVDLVDSVKQIPMVEEVMAQGDNILVNLKTQDVP
jgi:PGF-pre-PGF domain-containing protein